MTSPLLTAWHDLAARSHALPERELQRLSESLYTETRRALAKDPEARAEIVAAFAGGDEGLSIWLAGAVLPPGLGALENPDAFRDHPEVRLDSEELPVEAALALSLDHGLTADPDFRADPVVWTGSWIGGSPAIPRAQSQTWTPPLGAEGTPLAFVTQIDLNMEAANQGYERWSAIGLPDTGVLQIFHDLGSDGWSDDAGPAGAARWIEDVTVEELVLARPAAAAELMPLNPQLVPTCPAPSHTEPESARQERHLRARRWLDLVAVRANQTDQQQPTLTPWHTGYDPVPPVSRLRGQPTVPTDAALTHCLERRLPLTDADHHLLLLDLNPSSPEGQALAATIGTRHLEIWMRASDLAAARFDQTWPVLRG